MCFDHVLSSPILLPDLPTLSYPPYILSSFFFNPSSTVCVDHILLIYGFQWRVVNPPGAALSKKMVSPSQQPSTANNLARGWNSCLPPLCMLDFVCPEPPPILCMGFHLLWINMCSVPAVSRKPCFLVVAHCLRLLRSFHSFPMWSPNLGRRLCDTDVLFRAQQSTVSFSLHLDPMPSFSDEGWLIQ